MATSTVIPGDITKLKGDVSKAKEDISSISRKVSTLQTEMTVQSRISAPDTQKLKLIIS